MDGQFSHTPLTSPFRGIFTFEVVFLVRFVVSPYSFRGSIIKFESLASRLKRLGYKSALLGDVNFHAHVVFHKVMKNNGILPVHGLVKGKKIYIAKNREGYEELVRFYNEGKIENFKNIIVEDLRKNFVPIMYLNKSDRIGYEIMKKALGQKVLEGDFSLTKKSEDPCDIYDVESYDLDVIQEFPEVEDDFFDFEISDGKERERLEREVSLIIEKGFERYFKAVKIIVDTAKEIGVKVGPGRGSAVGSFVAFLLGITSINPLRYGLLFERFINEGRSELPDVDLDVEDVRRRELIKELSKKFKFVSLVSTYGNLKEKALKNLLNKVGVKYSERIKSLLEDLPVKRSIHAAGVIVSSSFLNLPCYDDDGLKVCEYDMDSLKEIGVEKIDVLGLKTLSFLRYLEEKTGISVDEIKEDGEVFESISYGETTGIFQLESTEAKRIARFVSPKNINELSHVLALNRPGPLKTGLDKKYMLRRISGDWSVRDELKDILNDTMGLPIYQEQIMLLAVRLSGMSLTEADLLRKAVAKKDPKKMEGVLKNLSDGMKRKGYDDEFIKETVSFIKEFASYSFNKSHSVAYSHISYWLMFFKEKYFPEFFMTYILLNTSSVEKIFSIVQEAIYKGYKVLPPDVNAPLGGVKDNELTLPIHVIKGVGIDYAKKVEELKPFRGVEEFSKKVGGGAVVESLIKAGAFDGLYKSRREALRAFKVGDVSGVIKKLKEKLGEKVEDIKPERVEDRVLLEREAMGFPVTVVEYNGESPEIAKTVTLSVENAFKVLSLGKGIITDGFSTVVVDDLPSGELWIVLSPDLNVVDFERVEKCKGYKRSCMDFEAYDDKIYLDCKPVLIKKG